MIFEQKKNRSSLATLQYMDNYIAISYSYLTICSYSYILCLSMEIATYLLYIYINVFCNIKYESQKALSVITSQ